MRYIFLLFCWVSIAHASLTPTEQALRQSVIAKQARQIETLKKLVKVNSGTSNIHGVHQVGEILRSEFEKLGFKTTWIAEPKSFNRAATLVAKHDGHSKAKRILLIGHLDTVFRANSAFQNFTRDEKFAHGPGVVDDKGGLVIILTALEALSEQHLLKNSNMTVVLTGDEEDSGKPAVISRKPLIDAAKQSDIALDFEEAVSLDTASIARRGIGAWGLSVQGREAHSSTIFEKDSGAGAIFELARILNSFRTEIVGMKNISYNPGLILGGTVAEYNYHKGVGEAFGKTNVIAKSALARGDFRYLTIDEKNQLENKMKTIVAAHLPGTSAEITFGDGIPAMPPTDNNLKLFKQYSAVSEDLGQGKLSVLAPRDRGAGDISYIAHLVPANLVGLGPMGWDTHSEKEMLSLKSLAVQTQRAAIFIYRLSE